MEEKRKRGARKAVNLLVRLKHPDVSAFAEQYATNLSPGGIFIRTRQPPPVGTLLAIKIEIAAGVRVLQGTATVRWTRAAGDPEGPPGMGLQFEELDEASRALIDRMMAAPAVPRAYPESAPSNLPVEDEPLSPPPPPAKAAAPAPVRPQASRPTPSPAVSMDPLEVNLDIAKLIAETPPPPPPKKPSLSDEVVGGIALDFEIEAIQPRPEARSSQEIELEDEGPPLELAREVRPGKGKAPVKAPGKTPPRVDAAKATPKLPETRREAPAAPARPQVPVVLTSQAKAAASPPVPRTPGQPVFLKPPSSLQSTGPVIGIDLGTTNSCVAVLTKGKPRVMTSKDGYNTIPSVVSLTPQGKLFVGHRAKAQLLLNPTRSIVGAKRLVGRDYESATVRQVRERFTYQICPDGAGKSAVRLGDYVVSLEEVQGLVLRECKEMAEQQLGHAVERAVVTCPAYYSEPQREAVRKAGALAGLKVERILNEPTAAALAYGMNRELSKKVLVYDLGGGTFDATLLRIDKNVFEVLATGGDVFLGGVDFDNQIVDHLLSRFQEQTGVEFSGDAVVLSRVSDAAERAKMALSERTSFEIHVPMLTMDANGKPLDLRCTVTRDDLNRICKDLVDRTFEVVKDVLLDAKLKASEVDDVILVGGQSRMPFVRERLKEEFKKTPHASVNADEAVALGAALYTGALEKVSSVVLIDVVPMTIGLGLAGGAFKRVIERNSPLPAQRSFGISTSKDDEEVIELSLFQGEDSNVSGNEYLGTVRIEGLPRGPKGAVQVAITIKLDSECVLHVEACELKTRRMFKSTLATRYTPEEIQKQLNISKEKVQASEAARGVELEKRSGRFWGFLKKVIGKS